MRMSAPVLAVATFLLSTTAFAGGAGKKVLMILSNGAPMGSTVARNNLWEYAEPHHVFVMHGYSVTFVSPKGGQVPFSLDADETDPPGMVSYTMKYEGFREKANNTLTPDRIDPDEYVAAFVGGGVGSLFDVSKDQRLLSIIARIYERGGIVGACGHGPGSLGDVKLSNGEYLAKAKRMTGFPNASEQNSKWTQGGKLLPFRVEDRLRARGAMFLTKADLADKHEPVIDQRLVTTMFLPSSAIVAQEMVNLLSTTAAASSVAHFAVGVETRDFVDEQRRAWQGTGPRPLATIIWYPAPVSAKHAATAEPNEHHVSLPATVQAPLSPAASKYPLLLLSHGATGRARALQWFAHYFAERGYIVAAVNHHGDTSTESELPPQGRMHFWERPADLSVALDSLLMDPKIGPHIDRDRIGVAGYSAGGGTAIQLAGAVFKPRELDSLCKANPARPGCDIPPAVQEQLTKVEQLAKVDPVVRASIARRDQSFKDDRIKGAFLIAPALGRLFTEQGLSTVNIPVAIVASRADKVTPLALDAAPYARLIASATLTEAPRDVSHFAFGSECTPAGKRTLRTCQEAEGVDQAELHRWVGALAHDFFAGLWK